MVELGRHRGRRAHRPDRRSDLGHVLGSLLLRGGHLTRRHSSLETVHPDGPPHVHAAGPDPYRLLMVGSGPLIGWGVSSHDLALPGALARKLASITGRGSTIDLILDPSTSLHSVGALLNGIRLDRYDGVIFAVGVNDALTGSPRGPWAASLGTLVERVLADAGDATQLFLLGVQPITSIPAYGSFLGRIAERHGALLNDVMESQSRRHTRVHYLPLPGQDPALGAADRHRTPAQYTAWALAIAPSVAGSIAVQRADASPAETRGRIDESARQRAVDRLPIARIAASLVVKNVVGLAHRAYRVEASMLTVIDGDQQFNIVRSGTDVVSTGREDSLCNIAIGEREALVIPDTLRDERFRTNPNATGDPSIRFYVGVPIEAPSGERIGALCILDSAPCERIADINLEYLRELAAIVEDEVWRLS